MSHVIQARRRVERCTGWGGGTEMMIGSLGVIGKGWTQTGDGA